MLVRIGQEVQALPRRLNTAGARRRIRLSARGAVVLGCVCVLAGCGSSRRPPALAGCPPCVTATIAQTRADTYAAVAMRIYFQEVFGAPNGAAFAVIAPLPGLVAGLASGDYALARRTLNRLPVRHAVRERVVRSGRVLLDVGLRFVIAGRPHRLTAPGGRYLGQIEISIQDVIGFIKLVHRLTGTEIVVRGSVGHHAASSLPAALQATLPSSGPTQVGRRRFIVSSFNRPGFGGEALNVWILAPA